MVRAVASVAICLSAVLPACGPSLARAGASAGATEQAVETLRVTSAVASAPGGLREALEHANAAAGRRTRIVFELPPGSVIHVFRSLPALTGSRIELDGEGAVLRGGSCVREDGRPGCSGLTVRGESVTVRNLTAEGFTFDGISVIGPRARNVSIVHSVLRNNLDDGIGISAAASDVRVEDCRLTGNGYRTKGKGVLVFDGARAVLRRNIVRANRDGVTVSRHAEAVLETNRIEENFDKGLGVSGAVVRGRENVIARNGTRPHEGESPPNGDGLRVGLTSSVHLADTLIESNGDSGVVAMDDSTVVLEGGHVIANGGFGVVATGNARVSLDRLLVADNAKGQIEQDDLAVVLGVPH